MKRLVILFAVLLWGCSPATGYMGGASVERAKPVEQAPAPTQSLYTLTPQPIVAHYKDFPDTENKLTVVSVDGDTATVSLAQYGELCTDTDVYGGTWDGATVLYSIHKGEIVRLRELSTDGSRVMIAPAEWIKLSALCE